MGLFKKRKPKEITYQRALTKEEMIEMILKVAREENDLTFEEIYNLRNKLESADQDTVLFNFVAVVFNYMYE